MNVQDDLGQRRSLISHEISWLSMSAERFGNVLWLHERLSEPDLSVVRSTLDVPRRKVKREATHALCKRKACIQNLKDREKG